MALSSQQNLTRIQIKLQAAPNQIFDALVTAPALTAWFCEYADVSRNDNAYDFWGRFTPEAPADQQAGHHPITAWQQSRHLSYQWKLGGVATHVLIKLLAREGETILTLRQTALNGEPPLEDCQLRDFWFLCLENLRAYLAGKPASARLDFSSPMVGDIHHEVIIDAPASEIFEVIIRPDEIDRWIGNGSVVDPRPDGKYSFGWMGMKILEIIPDQKLAVCPTQDNNGVEEITSHAFTWTLTENNGKTRLTFVHSGFAPDESNANANLGWLSYMIRVKGIAEFGAAWQHPLIIMEPELAQMYPIDIVQYQDELLPDLLAESDPLLAFTV